MSRKQSPVRSDLYRARKEAERERQMSRRQARAVKSWERQSVAAEVAR